MLYIQTASNNSSGCRVTVETAKELICSLERKSNEINRAMTRITATTSKAGNQQVGIGGTGSAKLPKLTLPTFDGNYLEWMNFWTIFKLNVHDRNNIAPAEKFTYLQGQLTGNARNTIAGIPVSDGNYDVVVKTLKERYQRTENQLIGALYSQLKRLPVSGGRVAELMSTFDSCEKIFRQLEAAGENIGANRSLVMDILSKYPSTVIKDLTERYKVGVDSSVSELRSALQSYVKQTENLAEILEELDPFVSKPTERPRTKPAAPITSTSREEPATTVKSPATQTSAFAASDNKSTTKPPNPCYFCGDHHFNSRCDKYVLADDRVKRLQQLNRCSKCLSSAHVVNACKCPDAKLKCFFCKHSGEHISPLCPVEFGSKLTEKDPGHGPPSSTSMLNAHEQALLLTAVTVAYNPDKPLHRTVRVIFDSGSHRSYVTAAFARQLALKPLREEPLSVAIFGTTRTLSVSSSQVAVDIQLRDGTKLPISVHATPLITNCPIQPAQLTLPDLTLFEAEGIVLADDMHSDNGSIDLLIGSDYFWEFVTGARRRAPSGIYLIPSTLGYLIGGRYEDGHNRYESVPTLLCLTETQSAGPIESGLMAVKSRMSSTYPDLDEYWSLEAIGITDDPKVSDDDEALSQFNSSIQFHDGRYNVKWPWKDMKAQLPTNYALALGRFNSLAKRLQTSDPEVFAKYSAVIADQLAKGVIEEVPEKFGEYQTCPNTVHYLPHHPVIKPTSTTSKVRIVYDASSKSKKDNPSLNECLYRGPVLLPDLCHIVIRFRLHSVALIADIEKAFLQMALHVTERDVTRFIWYADPSNPDIHNLTTYRFCRVPFGVISSPFLLGGTCQYHLKRTNTEISLQIAKDMYVDNVASGVETDSEAIEFYSKSKDIFSSAGMNLQEWCSNSETFHAAVPEADQTKHRDVKVLGMRLDSKSDTIRLNSQWKADASTIREVLQAISSVYDPLGLFLPVLLKAKLFLHKLWDEDHAWDEPLKPGVSETWKSIQSEITPIMGFRIPRFIGLTMKRSNVTIVAFSDASASAYAATVYLRSFVIDENRWVTSLVYAISRLSPTKRSKLTVSLPRLELLGLLIATRAALFVRNALQSDVIPIVLFCDSMCVLHWLKSSKPLSVFVVNRIREMKSAVGAEFQFVPTANNPADIASRGVAADKLLSNNMWWHGPEFLEKDVMDWPQPPSTGFSGDDVESAVAS